MEKNRRSWYNVNVTLSPVSIAVETGNIFYKAFLIIHECVEQM